MDYIVFDLEWSRNIRRVIQKCPDEIIQIGAVKYDKNMNYKGSFNRFIKPGVYDRVDSRVAQITGITKEHLMRFGVSFSEAFREFKSFMGHDSVLLSWGPQDIQILRVNAQYYDKNTKLNFMHRFADLQAYAAKRLGGYEKQQMGLTSAADLCKITYDPDTLHDAHVDAEISGKVLAHVFDKKSLASFIVDASKQRDIYHKKSAQKESESGEQHFYFVCPDCGKALASKRGWFQTSRVFMSFMRCKSCKTEFYATVEFYQGKDGSKRRKRRIKAIEKVKDLNTIQ